jgi:hypothetical protein
MNKQLTVIEKCERMDAHAPKWEIWIGQELVQTVVFRQYLDATIAYYKKQLNK